MVVSRSRAVAALAVTGALLLGIAACGEDEEGFTLYSGRNENLIGPLIQQFEDETGINVDVRYGDTAEMAAQLLDEGERTPADVFLAQDAGALGAVTKAGMFATLPEEVRSAVPELYQAEGGEWVGVTGRSRVLVYHQEQVAASELPESVFELTEPQWRGRVAVAPTNGSFQAFVTGMRVLHGDQATQEWLAGIAANDPQIREKNGEIVADVNEGRVDAGLVNHYYLYERAKEDGVEVDQLAAANYHFPDGDIGALMNVSGIGVLAGAEGDEQVRQFVDYLLSEDGQRYFTEETWEYPMTGAATVNVGLPEVSSLEVPDLDLNDLDTLDETVSMITESGLVG